jgi:uncharacterized protein (TIGR02596 family)
MEHDPDQLRSLVALEEDAFLRRALDSRSERGSRGFSIVELVLVCAILMILAVISGPSLVQSLRGGQLTRAVDSVTSLMEQARLTALTRRQTVEVRFFSYQDPTLPGKPGGVHSAQSYVISDTGTAAPLSRVILLPDAVVISTNTLLTTLWTLSPWTQSIPPISIPRAGGTFDCRSIRFSPQGLTSLAGNASQPSWCLTLLNVKDDAANAFAPPRNFATLVLDPYNGTVRTYRPTLK